MFGPEKAECMKHLLDWLDLQTGTGCKDTPKAAVPAKSTPFANRSTLGPTTSASGVQLGGM